MRSIRAYHRPQTLDEALALLTRSGIAARILAGGTRVTTISAVDPFEVVDLQALSLDGITVDGDAVVLGAMRRLQDVVDSELVPAGLCELALREGPNTLRNAATIGGIIASADSESELLAGLLVHNAVISVATSAGVNDMPLADVLTDRGALRGAVITEVRVATGGVTAAARTGRTPADRSIVAAVARLAPDGQTSVAVTGVAATPVLIDPDRLDTLEPPGDFRGSPEYRRALAAVLVPRAVAQVRETE